MIDSDTFAYFNYEYFMFKTIEKGLYSYIELFI